MPDYIEYRGTQEIRLSCMRCNTNLKQRTERTLYEKINETTYNPVIINNYETVEKAFRVPFSIKMGNGAKGEASAILCEKCSKEPLDAAAMIGQIRRGWRLELEAHGRDEEKIKEYLLGVGNISPWVEVYIV